LAEEDINFLLYQKIVPYFQVIDIEPGPRITKKDPGDDKFIRCALAGKQNGSSQATANSLL
jgi:hypothetical protein